MGKKIQTRNKTFSNRPFQYSFRSPLTIEGLAAALRDLSAAGCRQVYINGSFVTAKEIPGDYDLCWSIAGVIPEKLNQALLDFSPKGRDIMKKKYKNNVLAF